NPTGLKSLITKHESSDFIVPPLRCTLISKTSKMEEELTGQKVSLVSDSELAEGRLQDLVKLDRFTENNRYEPYTTQFVSVDSKPNPNPNLTPIAVFDGCRAYLSRNGTWEGS